MMTLKEKAQKCRISIKHLWCILNGKSKPSYKLSKTLEQIFKINRLSWLYPEEFFNPEAPYLYKGIWPPSLDHLEGIAKIKAQHIIHSFPFNPPNKEEFRKWKKFILEKETGIKFNHIYSSTTKKKRRQKQNET